MAFVVALVVLVVLGSLLPYLSMPYVTHSGDLAQERASLFPAVEFIGGLDPVWLPNFRPGPTTGQIQLALNVFNFGPDLQQVGLVVAALTCGVLCQNEINKFFWWPLHLSGWLLALSPIPLFVGLFLLRRSGVSITLHLAWLPLTAAGLLVLVVTLRAHSRIDTYASI